MNDLILSLRKDKMVAVTELSTKQLEVIRKLIKHHDSLTVSQWRQIDNSLKGIIDASKMVNEFHKELF